MNPSRVSPKFNAQDADICFKSSDNVLFLIHRESFKYSAARFPVVKYKIVPLTETSEVLELLFAFLYPNTLPDVRSLPIATLASLADAAEKYRVFSAMMTCNMRMTVIVNDHPIDVLRYAVIHQYKELLDTAAPCAIGWRLSEAVDHLPPNTIPAWIKYYQLWLDVRTSANFCHPNGTFFSAQEWRNNALALRIAHNMPPFSRFLYPNSSSS